MKVSVLISSLWTDSKKHNVLHKCISKIKNADEVLSLVTEKNTRLGFADTWNRLAKISTGDYLIFIGDNNILVNGDIRNLCIPNTVTFPLINNRFPEIPFTFCIPRNIYEKIGLYDEIYNNGVHWEDSDFWRKILVNKINYIGVDSVNFYKPSSGRSINKIKDVLDLIDRNEKVYKEKWGDNKIPNLNIIIKKFNNYDLFKDKLIRIRQLIFEWPLYLKGHIYQIKKKKKKKVKL